MTPKLILFCTQQGALEGDEKPQLSRMRFQPNPLIEQLLNGNFGCFTTSPHLPTELLLDVGTLAFRPGEIISCSVAATEKQLLPKATLDCLEVKVKMGAVDVALEKRLVDEGNRLVLTFNAAAQGCYQVSARISSLDVLGSPLNLPVLEDPVAVLAKLGLEPLGATGTNFRSIGGDLKIEPVLEAGAVTVPKSNGFPQVEKVTSELSTREMQDISNPSSRSFTKPSASQIFEPELSTQKPPVSQAYGKYCFVEHEGMWHAGILHAVIHDALMTVRNLTLDQFRGVHPKQVVFKEIDLPEGCKLAPSALELVKREAEEMSTETKNSDQKVNDEKRFVKKAGDHGATDQRGLKVTLGFGTERVVSMEEHRTLDLGESENPREEKCSGESKPVQTPHPTLKAHEDEKRWQEGNKCLARWEVDKVVHLNYFQTLSHTSHVYNSSFVTILSLVFMISHQVWYRATVLDALEGEGDYLVLFNDYNNEAVVGWEEIAGSVHQIPVGDEVDVNVCQDSPSQDVAQIKVEGRDCKYHEVSLIRPGVGEQCVAKWSDMVWYRASVDEVQEDGAIVLFIDYGNSDFIVWDLIELNASCIPPEDTRDPNLPPKKVMVLTDCKVLRLRLRLEIRAPLRVAIVESSGEVLVLTGSEIRRYSRQGVLICTFCSDLHQPSHMLLLKSGEVRQA